MGVAKPDFLRCVGADQISIENVECFARIDLDMSDFKKERTHYLMINTLVSINEVAVLRAGYYLDGWLSADG